VRYIGFNDSATARVAKLADARDLKSRVSKETYRFNSGPGHHLTLAITAILVQPRLRAFGFRLWARARIMAEIMAVLDVACRFAPEAIACSKEQTSEI
jgi:hypothetical protein